MKTRKLILSIAVLFSCAILAHSQESIEKEVNAQVWKPFVKVWSSFDAEAFNKLHTEDVLRASQGGLKLGKEYHESNIVSFTKSIAKEVIKKAQVMHASMLCSKK